jgi:lipopolysaccharide/colanic/teichoic acid biosynthesis glycosyltransferase
MRKTETTLRNKFLKYIFYAKVSPGLNGKLISVWKLRTMKINADQNTTTNQLEGGDKPVDDPRIIPWLKFVRRLGLDELPQIVNIFQNDMAIFGPRPTSLNRFKNLPERYKNVKKSVKPGILGHYAVKNISRHKNRKNTRTLIEYEIIYEKLRRRKKEEGKYALTVYHWIIILNTIVAIYNGDNK